MSVENKNISIAKVNAEMANGNQKITNKIRAQVVESRKQENGANKPGKSQALSGDPFHALSIKGAIIEPPFDMLTLAMMPEHSSEMVSCVDAMRVNIDGFGHRFISRIKKNGEKKVDSVVEKERVDLINFFQYCTVDSFIEFREKLRSDLETTGNAYFEVIRDLNDRIQSFVHLPSYQMRLSKLEDEHVLAQRKILKLQYDGSVSVETISEYRKFRKFVQSRSIHLKNLSIIGDGKLCWFKEYGDVRKYDSSTGEMDKNGTLPKEKQANEVVHMKIYSPRTPYGLPRFIGNLLSIFGDRAAEEINYTTFKNNNIPSMVVCVSNGQLTQGSIDRITTFVESQIQGSDNLSKFLILEAEGSEEGEESGSNIKIEIKPLTENQRTDAMFQNYSKGNQDRIRRVWRLPPIFVGKAEDYTRATADSSRVLADEQVFGPERNSFDDFMNRRLFPEMGIIYHSYRSNSPNTTDNQEMVKILGGSEKTGGMTPRIAREILEEILSKDLPEFPDGFPLDVPFSLTMAEAVKNQAQPSEPGQQVTALKVVEDALLTIQKNMEKQFEIQIEESRK